MTLSHSKVAHICYSFTSTDAVSWALIISKVMAYLDLTSEVYWPLWESEVIHYLDLDHQGHAASWPLTRIKHLGCSGICIKMDAFAVKWMHMQYNACICSTMTTWSSCMHMHYHDLLIIKGLALFWILDWIYMSIHIPQTYICIYLFSHYHYLVSWIILSCSWQGRHLSVLGRMKKVVRRSARITPKPATLTWGRVAVEV